MSAIIVTDAFWGDAGKGKFAAYLSYEEKATACIRAGVGPNAGHSTSINGHWTKTRLVPLGVTCPTTSLAIGPGVLVDPELLMQEIVHLECQDRLTVDYRCGVIEPEHKVVELHDPVMNMIDSTRSGAGAARADYVMRRARRVGDLPELRSVVGDAVEIANSAARHGVLVVEGSQATMLSLNLSDRYPYVTSKNCTASAFMDDIGLNWRLVERVILLVKCLPTAVGHGPLPDEMSESEIRARGLEEFGTNTGRPRRRVRSIDFDLLRFAAEVNGATEIALTWCDQFDPDVTGVRADDRVTRRLRSLVDLVEKECSIPVSYLETGKDLFDIVHLSRR